MIRTKVTSPTGDGPRPGQLAGRVGMSASGIFYSIALGPQAVAQAGARAAATTKIKRAPKIPLNARETRQ